MVGLVQALLDRGGAAAGATLHRGPRAPLVWAKSGRRGRAQERVLPVLSDTAVAQPPLSLLAHLDAYYMFLVRLPQKQRKTFKARCLLIIRLGFRFGAGFKVERVQLKAALH